VQVAAEPTALVLAGGDHLRPRPDEVGLQPHGLDGGTRLLGERVDEAEIERLERVLPAAAGDEEAADLFPLMTQGHHVDGAHRGAVHGARLVPAGAVGQFDRGVRDSERAGHCVDDGG